MTQVKWRRQRPAESLQSIAKPKARSKPTVAVLVISLMVFVMVIVVSGSVVLPNYHLTKKLNAKKSSKQEVEQTDQQETKRFVKVAMLGDTSIHESTRQVLELVKQEETDMVLHAGDIDYIGDAERWESFIDEILGDDFAYFFTKGNYEETSDFQPQHDTTEHHPNIRGGNPTQWSSKQVWEEYVKRRKRRMDRLGVSCLLSTKDGDIACQHMGISFVLSTLTTNQYRVSDDLRFVEQSLDELARLNAKTVSVRANVRGASKLPTNFGNWFVCVWHAPFIPMQLGFRPGVPVMQSIEVITAYNKCRKHGALVLNGHEHYYVRSNTVAEYSRHKVTFVPPEQKSWSEATGSDTWPSSATNTHNNDAEDLVDVEYLDNGRNFVIVAGLGGHSVSVPSLMRLEQRPQLRKVHPSNLLTDIDPMGKLFYGDFTGIAHTTSNVIQGTRGDGYPFGALFCEFEVNGTWGRCYFKTIEGKIVDRFLLRRERASYVGHKSRFRHQRGVDKEEQLL